MQIASSKSHEEAKAIALQAIANQEEEMMCSFAWAGYDEALVNPPEPKGKKSPSLFRQLFGMD